MSMGFFAAGAMGQGSTPPPPGSTWDAALKGANIVLSAGDLVATKSGAGYQSVYGVTGHSSGRRAFEVLVTARPTVSSILIGIADKTNPSSVIANYLGNNTGAVETLGYNDHQTVPGGRMYRRMTVGTATVTAIQSYLLGYVITCDVDFSANTVVFSRDGTPITYGAVSITASKTYFPAASLQNDAAVQIITSGLTYLPSGATEWG